MDLIRRLSGFRSSHDLSTRRTNDDLDEWPDETSDDNGGDLAEKREEKRDGSGNDTHPSGASLLRVRAPVSVENEGSEDDDYDYDFNPEEDEEDDSVGSYDSALERIAGSSVASHDAQSSSHMASPMESFSESAMIGTGDLNPFQKDALKSLNEMISGSPSLGISVISGSPEQFKSLVADVAESRGMDVEDPSLVNVVETLLPLVQEVSQKKVRFVESEADSERRQREMSPMPKAKLSAEDESDEEESYHYPGDDLEENRLQKGDVEESPVRNGDGSGTDSQHGKEMLKEKSKEGVNSGNGEGLEGGRDGGAYPTRMESMPKAKLSVEDADERDEYGEEDEESEDYLSGDSQNEEDSDELEEGNAAPSKIRAVPSDLSAEFSLFEFAERMAMPEQNFQGEEIVPKARVPSSEGSEPQSPSKSSGGATQRASEETGEVSRTQDSSKQQMEKQSMIVAKLSEDEGQFSADLRYEDELKSSEEQTRQNPEDESVKYESSVGEESIKRAYDGASNTRDEEINTSADDETSRNTDKNSDRSAGDEEGSPRTAADEDSHKAADEDVPATTDDETLRIAHEDVQAVVDEGRKSKETPTRISENGDRGVESKESSERIFENGDEGEESNEIPETISETSENGEEGEEPKQIQEGICEAEISENGEDGEEFKESPERILENGEKGEEPRRIQERISEAGISENGEDGEESKGSPERVSGNGEEGEEPKQTQERISEAEISENGEDGEESKESPGRIFGSGEEGEEPKQIQGRISEAEVSEIGEVGEESKESPGRIFGSGEEGEEPKQIQERTSDAEVSEIGEDGEESKESPEKISENGDERDECIQKPGRISDMFENDDEGEDSKEGSERIPEISSSDEGRIGADEVEDLVEKSTDNDEDSDDDDDEDGVKILERSPALAALLRVANSTASTEVDSPSLGAAGPSLPARPVRPLSSRPPQNHQPSIAAGLTTTQLNAQVNARPTDGNEETREKLQTIRVKLLRLGLRLGQSPQNAVVAQVLYRLGLAEQLRGGRSNSAFSFDRAKVAAQDLESAGSENLDFSCTILLLGKTGVGKSATINSIFDEAKAGTNAFDPSTRKVQVVDGLVHGIKVRVIDTPGLLTSLSDQNQNEKAMGSVRRFIKNEVPDIVLYFDRLDMQSRDYGDLPLLRTITETFGAAVWFNAIVVLTHAASAPPDGPSGIPISYDMFVAQRSHLVQHMIRQAAGDMRLMNPVTLAENHMSCRVNRGGERVLPNGQVWKSQLLLLCFASKILAEANGLLKLQDGVSARGVAGRAKVPPLPFLLSSLLQSRAQLQLPDEQTGEEDESDEDGSESGDSDEEEEDYDQLPPFRRLSKVEEAELDAENRRNYFEELAERERLFQKKQWKEEVKRRREVKRRMAETPTEQSQVGDEGQEDEAGPSTVPVAMPDLAIPPSFDADNPSHRYRYLETANQWNVRPVLETHGWDHDIGYDGMNVEKMFVVRDNIPGFVSGSVTKDKKETNLNMESAASLRHGNGKVTLAGLEIQTVGKDFAYTARTETKFSNFKGNKTTGGLAVTVLGDSVSSGLKIEDRLMVGKRVKLVVNAGAMTGSGNVAYGGSMEASLRGKNFPLSRTLSTLGVSVMDWHGDLAIGGNWQSQFVLGKTVMVGRANLNNRGAGQITIRASSSEQLQMALIGLLPIIRSLANRLLGGQPHD